MNIKIKCPECGSENIATILYGMPAMTGELQTAIDNGEVVLGGCIVSDDGSAPEFVCNSCDMSFTREQAHKPKPPAFFSASDLAWIENVSTGNEEAYDDFPYDESWRELASAFALVILRQDSSSIADLSLELQQYGMIADANRLLLLGLEYGVALGDGDCANNLGALYYNGTCVEQDFTRAKEFYELAEKLGNEQATVNLGYIYEYGRTGKPDYSKAVVQYAKAAALWGSAEALYKLGDMFNRGKGIEADKSVAYKLYERSFEESEHNAPVRAQAALRVAKIVGNPDCTDLGATFDPLRALQLYQVAEYGLRIDISNGLTYYRKRLSEAIEGQEKMREILDAPM